MNDYNLYENAMQVVPLLLIALFVDNRSLTDTGQTSRGRRWLDLQNRAVAALCLISFFTSVFVVATVLPLSGVTNGIVIAALCGSIGFLFAFISGTSSERHPQAHHQTAGRRNETGP